MPTHSEITLKLKRIFTSFLSENYAATNNVYFEKMITHLKDSKYSGLLQAPFVIDWVDKCIELLTEDFNRVNPKVTSFMLNLGSLMTLNEWTVIEIRERKLMDRVRRIIDRDIQKFNPSIKLGSIRLLASVAHFSLGLAYVRNTQAWRFLIEYCNNDHTLYVIREARQLLYDLLYKFSVKTNDEQTVLEILQELLKPLLENVFNEHSEKINIVVDDSDIQYKVSATLELISYIFQQTLESEEKTNIVHLCEANFNLEINIWKLIETTHDKDFLQKILTALTSFNFAKLIYEKWESDVIAPENFNGFGVNFYNTMKFCVERRECVIFLKLAELNHILWKKLNKRAPVEILIENERIRFENQLITFHILPLLFILRSKEFREEEIFDKYVMKLFTISCEHTLRICYAYRDVIDPQENEDGQLIADLAYKSIHGILSLENILEREQAVLLFQAMIFALKEFILNSNRNPKTNENENKTTTTTPNKKNTELIIEIPNVLYAALIGLQQLIQRYKISWKESLESICLVNFVIVILEDLNLSTRLAVQALKLVQLAVEHFLSPNMALLVDHLKDSGLLCLGPIILQRFHDNAWEVRDSTLELVASMAHISLLKFPAFQKFLADRHMATIIYQMAKNDCEPYVRGSALKCLTKMISINIIWENELCKFNLVEHLLSVLYNDSEAIVRKEAVCALTKIYEDRKIANQYKNAFYSTMTYCAVTDLHWEVKICALQFWKLEIQTRFIKQGMLDGIFPAVTFSTEHKKIVKLTSKEVNVRIVKIFNELSQNGCLGVILRCLNDECDFEVIKTTSKIVHCLLDKLKIFDYETIIDELECNSNANDNSAQVEKDQTETITSTETETETSSTTTEVTNDTMTTEPLASDLNADEVIESILSSQDINYLITAYERQMQINANNNSDNETKSVLQTIDEFYYKKFANISAKKFLNTIKDMDLEKLLENRNEWLMCTESFSSLLDDIICILEPDGEINFADCY